LGCRAPTGTSAAASLPAMSQMSWMRVGGKGAGLQAWSAVPGKLKGFWNRRQWQNMMQHRQVSDDANVVVKIPVDRKLPTDPVERKAAILVSPGHSVPNFRASHAHSHKTWPCPCVSTPAQGVAHACGAAGGAGAGSWQPYWDAPTSSRRIPYSKPARNTRLLACSLLPQKKSHLCGRN
jgi:hypothetical protein